MTYQTELMPETYQGWSNYETWNVALWMGNDEGLYNCARRCTTYREFVEYMGFEDGATADGVKWMDPMLNTVELDEMMEEM